MPSWDVHVPLAPLSHWALNTCAALGQIRFITCLHRVSVFFMHSSFVCLKYLEDFWIFCYCAFNTAWILSLEAIAACACTDSCRFGHFHSGKVMTNFRSAFIHHHPQSRLHAKCSASIKSQKWNKQGPNDNTLLEYETATLTASHALSTHCTGLFALWELDISYCYIPCYSKPILVFMHR